MKNTLIVNMIGCSCSGKSSHAMGLASALKAEGLEVGFVQEYCKNFFYEGTQYKLDNQFLVTGKQIEQTEIFIEGGVDVIVTESPIILGTVYSEEYGKDYALGTSIRQRFHQYNNFNIKLNSDVEFKPHGRGKSGIARQVIDERLRSEIKSFDAEYSTSELVSYKKLVSKIKKRIIEARLINE